ncbi:CTLH/CRA C-terminal to lish motif domain-containing protein [Blyttiomyces helicus]|uniref:CTLH/CRA C-terminal to lish motif domain-containing protein n=1 Tax=Blyttiomyces helicus TaxID=388810 RepID=A0A4P9WM89_9FUNG|nr:CTLH/CRA C-terminal to lish motif domain-containing protein [Blyttiomyces helicus]|eukprot:RKO93572.1 CTLH/CRA C-terminal to lish motif domain-containing protein [Blyttiomyces helicus]
MVEAASTATVAPSSSNPEESFASTPLEPTVVRRLVYDHLVHNCYSETAKAFGRACQLGPPGTYPLSSASAMDLDQDGGSALADADGDICMGGVANEAAQESATSGAGGLGGSAADTDADEGGALGSLEARKKLYHLLMDGKVTEAIAYCASAFPQALAGDSPQTVEMRFLLQCQQFIERVRTSGPEALTFARNELGEIDPKMKDVVGLIAYADPERSPLAEYLSPRRREQVATSLNSHILSLENLPPHTSIERLVSQATVVRDTMYTEATREKKGSKGPIFPKWELSGYVAMMGK